MYKEIDYCRNCGNKNLIPVFSLGFQQVKDFVDVPEKSTESGPLELVLCQRCKLLQLKHTFSKDFLYTHYWYRSGTSPTMVKQLEDIVKSATQVVNLNEGDYVVDIGANDGTLLKQYHQSQIHKIGFEPSHLSQYGKDKDTLIINDYFDGNKLSQITGGGRVKIITSIAMFYDLDDPGFFVKGIKENLSKDGIWIVQMNYLGLMIQNLGFDNICHEHVTYHSLSSFQYLIRQNGLEVFDVYLNDVNAGSIRIFVKNADDESKKVNAEHINSIIDFEKKIKIDEPSTYVAFYQRMLKLKESLVSLIDDIIREHKKLAIYGASTRGLVILEFCGIDKEKIPIATDKNEEKWGKYFTGSGIKIISLNEFRKLSPDYILVLPYQYANEIAFQERDLLKNGCKMIIPLPRIQILDYNYLQSLDSTKEFQFLEGFSNIEE